MGLGSERDLVPLGAGFDIVKRGYNQRQVEDHLERLDGDLRLIAADRDAAVSQATELARQLERARTDIDELRGQVNRLSLPPTTLEGLSERLQRMLKLAQEEASDTKARAEADAVQIRARSEADGAALRNRYEKLIAEVDGRRVELETEHHELVEKSLAELVAKGKQAEAERAKADAEAAARRSQIDDDFEIAMAARRTESMRALADQEATGKVEAERRLREATDEATRIRTKVGEEQRSSKAEAERQLREATDKATQIRTQVAEEQRTSKAEAERRLREATEEAGRRRHEAITEAKARVQDAIEDANRRVREATEEAGRRVSHAAGRVEALRTLRSQIAEQLRTAHTLISNAAPALEPLPEERSEGQTTPIPGPDATVWPVADTMPVDVPADAPTMTNIPPTKPSAAPNGRTGQAEQADNTEQTGPNAPTRRTVPVTPHTNNQNNQAPRQPQPTRPSPGVRQGPTTKR